MKIQHFIRGKMMKKILVLVLVMVSLVSCGNVDTSSNDMNNVEISNSDLSNDETVAQTESFDYKIKSVTNGITVNPQTAYYNEAGDLVVTGYIENEVDHTITTIRMSKLEIYNEDDELIAEDAIGYLTDNFIEPYGNLEWTFTFPSVTVIIADDDLESLSAVTVSSSKYY